MQKYEEMIANGLTPIPRMGEPEDVGQVRERARGRAARFCHRAGAQCGRWLSPAAAIILEGGGNNAGIYL